LSRNIYLPEKWIQKERGGNEFSEKTDLYFYFINDSARLTMVERIGIQFRFTISMRLAENEIEEEEKIREEKQSLFGSFWRVEFYFLFLYSEKRLFIEIWLLSLSVLFSFSFYEYYNLLGSSL
jgi:hypothetical protein